MSDLIAKTVVDQNILIKSPEMRSLLETMRATTAITAAYIAHFEAERDSDKALEAIRLASWALSALDDAAAAMRASLSERASSIRASAQMRAYCHSGESGACPCLPCAISSNTPAGPMDSKCASFSADSPMDAAASDVDDGGILPAVIGQIDVLG